MNANSVNEKYWTALRNDALLFKVKALLVCGLTEDNGRNGSLFWSAGC